MSQSFSQFITAWFIEACIPFSPRRVIGRPHHAHFPTFKPSIPDRHSYLRTGRSNVNTTSLSGFFNDAPTPAPKSHQATVSHPWITAIPKRGSFSTARIKCAHDSQDSFTQMNRTRQDTPIPHQRPSASSQRQPDQGASSTHFPTSSFSFRAPNLASHPVSGVRRDGRDPRSPPAEYISESRGAAQSIRSSNQATGPKRPSMWHSVSQGLYFYGAQGGRSQVMLYPQRTSWLMRRFSRTLRRNGKVRCLFKTEAYLLNT